ncbi:MAG TPA: heme-binding domain-containing protein [Candidatus Solibacter sp.]|nr:heme-binding domain-containing protein [Candidatus Solibacter sp.]
MRKLYSITLAVVAATGLMNLARVDRTNPPVDPAQGIEAHTRMPANVAGIFRRACQDCHSERTDWPWYSAVAPFHWLMTADVYGARSHMNLSAWGRYTAEEQTGRLIGICEMVAGDKMPLWYYKPAHYPSAWLSASDKKAVCDWTKSEVQRSTLTQNLSSEEGDRR